MLRSIKLTNVGPSPELAMELSPRLNLITGDNGLGKSFLLDVAWWSLTGYWPEEVNPRMQTGKKPIPSKRSFASIDHQVGNGTEQLSYHAVFDPRSESWENIGSERSPTSWDQLVLYSLADGSYAIFDPRRNIRSKFYKITGRPDTNPAFVFTSWEVWDGLKATKSHRFHCNGLISDWASWQRENGDSFQKLKEVLKELSPSQGEILVPGELTRVSIDDVRDIPTIVMGNGQQVPVIYASSGIKRILATAYLLVWTWQEHVKAAELLGLDNVYDMVFLFDEVESHLHPTWQRSIVRAMMSVVEQLSDKVHVQMITTTHSPLIMASVEPLFDPTKDAWFDLDLRKSNDCQGTVVLSHRPFVRHGDASNWLTSEAFDLASARSIEAEQILESATKAMTDPGFSKTDAQRVYEQLQSVLGDTDPFWVRWRFVAEKKGWLE